MPAAEAPGQSFGERLREAITARSALCVGIDPHPYLLEEWGLAEDAEGLTSFGLRVLDAAAGVAAAIKPQVAFFERAGAAGYAALERVLTAARERELLVIADAKRGDIGTSVAAYGEAWLAEGSPLEADALTVSAYQGMGSLADVIALAQRLGKGLFVLCATSNPESRELQRAMLPSGSSVQQRLEAQAWALNFEQGSTPGAPGSIGLVIGATLDPAAEGLALHPETPILAPGFGAQGTQLSELSRRFPTTAPVLASVSRSVLQAGPGGIADAARAAAAELT